jgi:hypothetical protein
MLNLLNHTLRTLIIHRKSLSHKDMKAQNLGGNLGVSVPKCRKNGVHISELIVKRPLRFQRKPLLSTLWTVLHESCKNSSYSSSSRGTTVLNRTFIMEKRAQLEIQPLVEITVSTFRWRRVNMTTRLFQRERWVTVDLVTVEETRLFLLWNNPQVLVHKMTMMMELRLQAKIWKKFLKKDKWEKTKYLLNKNKLNEMKITSVWVE